MDELISRQAVMDAFGLSEKTRKYGGDHSGYDTLMKYEIQDVLENLPPVTPEPKVSWIPVSEKLPEDSGEYLVTVIDEDDETYKHTGIAWYAHPKDYDVKEGDWRDLMIDEVVIAWMPKPKPYKPD